MDKQICHIQFYTKIFTRNVEFQIFNSWKNSIKNNFSVQKMSIDFKFHLKNFFLVENLDFNLCRFLSPKFHFFYGFWPNNCAKRNLLRSTIIEKNNCHMKWIRKWIFLSKQILFLCLFLEKRYQNHGNFYGYGFLPIYLK